MKNAKINALEKLTDEEMARVAGGMSCEKAKAISNYYDALGTALQSAGYSGLASVANTMSGGLVSGACAP